jgi:HAD superfamily hydrolase (TIGR01484 family)
LQEEILTQYLRIAVIKKIWRLKMKAPNKELSPKTEPENGPENAMVLTQFKNSGIEYLFTDIDDTITDQGQLHADAYQALWDLSQNGVSVVPVTGRPAGWCEMIARFWPVQGVIGENGAFYFRYHQKKMQRHFLVGEAERLINRKKLDQIAIEILKQVPGTAIASDQFCRLMDLAIDFCEDVPALKDSDVQKIVKIFEKHGATAKVSSIHVNAWFGEYDKLSMCQIFADKELGFQLSEQQDKIAFSGDSPNDEPMFAFFKNSFAVANIKKFASQLKHQPHFVAASEGGKGFVEIAAALMKK